MMNLQFAAIAMLVVCLAAQARAQDNAATKQDAAIAAIKKLGGTVKVDEKLPGKPVIEVYLSRTKITDAGLAHLKNLTKIRKLFLFSTPVTDAGLGHLKGMTELRILKLQNTKVSDAGLVHLKGLTKLRLVLLYKTKVTDVGVAGLREALPRCTIRR